MAPSLLDLHPNLQSKSIVNQGRLGHSARSRSLGNTKCTNCISEDEIPCAPICKLREFPIEGTDALVSTCNECSPAQSPKNPCHVAQGHAGVIRPWLRTRETTDVTRSRTGRPAWLRFPATWRPGQEGSELIQKRLMNASTCINRSRNPEHVEQFVTSSIPMLRSSMIPKLRSGVHPGLRSFYSSFLFFRMHQFHGSEVLRPAAVP